MGGAVFFMDKALAAKAYIRQQARKASDYFKPTENVRVRDFVREVPGAVGQMFSGTRDTVVKGGKILGEGLAYATSPNVRKMYQAGNTNILPTVSNTTPRQMLGNTAKSAMEILPVSKIKGLATAAMSAKLAPRMIAGGAMGYGYDVADKLSRPEPISQSTFNPGIATLAGALMGGLSKPTAQMIGQTGREIGDDIRNLNPANRLSHRVVDKYDYEPVPGVFAPGGIQQQRPIMESFRKEVETTQMPFEPQSSIAKLLLGKQAPVGMSIKAVDDPLLQEARKYKSAEEFVFNTKNLFRGTNDEGVNLLNAGNIPKEGLSMSLDPSIAKKYAQSRGLSGYTIEKNLLPNAKIITLDKVPNSIRSSGEGTDFAGKAAIWARKQGYDVLDMTRGNEVEMRILNKNVLTTKSQLTDIWNKANKATPESSLLAEAKKYKSAEEFVSGAGKLKTRYDWNYLDEMQKSKDAGEGYSHSDYGYLTKLAEKYRGKEPSEPFFRAGKISKSSLGEKLDDIYLTDNEGLAQQYSSEGSKVGEYRVLSQNPLDATDSKVLQNILGEDYKELPNSQTLKQKLIKYAKDNGYDSVRFPDSGPDGEGVAGNSLVVWNKNLVKTKSQLTDLYHQATKE